MNKRFIRRGLEYYIETEPLGGEDYEYQMLMANEIEYLLPVRLERVDQKKQVLYEMTGCHSVTNLFGEKRIEEEQMKSLLAAILGAIKSANEYLLYPDNLFLEKDWIFYHESNESFMFMYVPGYQTDILTQIRGLIDYLGEKVDEQNVEAVMFVWRMQMLLKRSQISLKEIESRVCEAKEVKITQDVSRAVPIKNERESKKGRNIGIYLLIAVLFVTTVLLGTEGYILFHIYYYGIMEWKRNILLGNTALLFVAGVVLFYLVKKEKGRKEIDELFSKLTCRS